MFLVMKHVNPNIMKPVTKIYVYKKGKLYTNAHFTPTICIHANPNEGPSS